MECESRIIEEKCGCVQFYMPRLHNDTNICNQKDFKCYNRLSTVADLGIDDSITCKCMPGCFEINYKPSVYISELGNGSYMMRERELTEKDLQRLVYIRSIYWSLKEFFFENRKSIAVVHIYYEESYFRSFTKEELIGFTEFLCRLYAHLDLSFNFNKKTFPLSRFTSANTGGLLGLFMGFSVVSIIEIIYFISLRPYCTSRREREKFDRNIKFVEPSKKVWFVEDVDNGKLVQLNQTKNAWDGIDGSKGSKSVAHYPYRE